MFRIPILGDQKAPPPDTKGCKAAIVLDNAQWLDHNRYTQYHRGSIATLIVNRYSHNRRRWIVTYWHLVVNIYRRGSIVTINRYSQYRRGSIVIVNRYLQYRRGSIVMINRYSRYHCGSIVIVSKYSQYHRD